MTKPNTPRSRSASFNDEAQEFSTNAQTSAIKYYRNSSSQESDDPAQKIPRACSEERNKNMLQIEQCLEQLNNKIDYFKKRSQYNIEKRSQYNNIASFAKKCETNKYRDACSAAIYIYNNLQDLVAHYKNDKNGEMSLSEFKKKALNCFNQTVKPEVKELHKHRGYKEILANLLAAVLALPVYLAVALYKGTFFVLRPQTDAGKKVDALIRAVEHVADDEAETQGLR